MKMTRKTLAALTLTLVTGSAACSAAPIRSENGKIYVFESDASGFNTKNVFYDNGEEVVVFDTQFTPDIAEKSIAFLRTKTNHPISYVVITHPNPDKFNGMSAFQKLGAKVIASTKTSSSIPEVAKYKRNYFVNVAKMFTDATYPGLSQVDLTFDQAYDLPLSNGEIISLRELDQPGVSSNQTIAMIPSLQSVIVGDLIHGNVHAWLEGGIVNGNPTPTLPGWIADLGQIQALLANAPDTLVYGGRGDALPLSQAVPAQIAYLNAADQIVSNYVASLGSRKSELSGPNAQAHYLKIQALFEKAYPGFGLGYMIQYGVYGLVNSKL